MSIQDQQKALNNIIRSTTATVWLLAILIFKFWHQYSLEGSLLTATLILPGLMACFGILVVVLDIIYLNFYPIYQLAALVSEKFIFIPILIVHSLIGLYIANVAFG